MRFFLLRYLKILFILLFLAPYWHKNRHLPGPKYRLSPSLGRAVGGWAMPWIRKASNDNWILNLGDVRESARAWLNGNFLGTAWSVPLRLNTGALQETNKLVLEVSNLAANRNRAREKNGEEWKIFHEINMVNIDYKPFDASLWNHMPSGLLGELSLTPLQSDNNAKP